MRPLVFVLALAVVASCSRGAPPDAGQGPAGAAPPPAAAASASSPVLPGSIAGWAREGAVKRFGPGNLWEHINGAAEQFLSFGFQELETARYTLAVGRTVTVDLYRMTDRLHAFGVYAQEANPKRAAVAIGVEGRAGSDAAEFWSGPYYAKLVVMPGGPDGKAVVSDVARGLAAALGPPGGKPEEVALLPAEGLVADSIRLVPEDALGQAAFAGALQATYGARSAASTLVMVPFGDAGQAAAAAGQYASFLGSGGPAARQLPGLIDGGFVAREAYYGQIVTARCGRWLLISLGAPSEQAATDLLTLAAGRVRAAAAAGAEARP